MTLEACTELLRQHDPDRFGALLTAAPGKRPALVTLYALNLEIARAPFQSAEPMLAEMRLQWWIERLAEMGSGIAPPLHDVLTPLWNDWGRDAGALTALVEARRRDCERMPFDLPADVIDYIAASSGGLMWHAARCLGAAEEQRATIADQALGAGLAAWLRVLPELRQLGLGLAHERPEQIQELAVQGLEAMRRAASGRHRIPRDLAAALYPGPRAAHFLNKVARGRIDCFRQIYAPAPIERRASLAKFALTGRWWN
ncbi:squalene/phytoene synthase family protein [Paracoccus onubensis]|uniref:squalene/phytoene synthase family protein n=1 Tax=Paracoccus onubensis TaxID=1675788 RepID=UPI002731386B|nr:squalene/phytoene synthase family protein [Paracoccus onubensis]MDP0927401.1 squalene/phytoene synthase family protein [Paracoccus onubensis]